MLGELHASRLDRRGLLGAPRCHCGKPLVVTAAGAAQRTLRSTLCRECANRRQLQAAPRWRKERDDA